MTIKTCQNCGTELHGDFCHNCGQQALSSSRFFGSVFLDLLSNIFSYDSKAFRTLSPLLLKPGFLSNEYIAGRRARYIQPFRLYLFTSVICFLLMSAPTDLSGVSVELDETPTISTELSRELSEELQKTLSDESGKALPDTSPAADNPTSDKEESIEIRLSPELESLSKWLEQQQTKIEKIGPEGLIELLLDALPKFMLILLPLFALALKVFYLGSKRYYIEHFVVTLHTQSFLFVLAIFVTIAGSIAELAAPGAAGPPAVISGIATLWALIYTPVMLRRVYGQSRTVTIIKYINLLFIYLILNGILLALAFTWNILTL